MSRITAISEWSCLQSQAGESNRLPVKKNRLVLELFAAGPCRFACGGLGDRRSQAGWDERLFALRKETGGQDRSKLGKACRGQPNDSWSLIAPIPSNSEPGKDLVQGFDGHLVLVR